MTSPEPKHRIRPASSHIQLTFSVLEIGDGLVLEARRGAAAVTTPIPAELALDAPALERFVTPLIQLLESVYGPLLVQLDRARVLRLGESLATAAIDDVSRALASSASRAPQATATLVVAIYARLKEQLATARRLERQGSPPLKVLRHHRDDKGAVVASWLSER